MADTDSGADASSTTTPAVSLAPAVSIPAASVPTASLGYILVVRHAFGDYLPGTEITDAETIKDILAGELAIYVIKRAA